MAKRAAPKLVLASETTPAAIDSARLERLQQLLTTWQERLRLRDWQLTLVFEPDANDYDLVGEVAEWNSSLQKANVHIYGRDQAYADETTIVHELLHVRFYQLVFDDRYENVRHRAFEDGLDMVADALVRAYAKKE
jgi:hypothetical protein